MHLGEENLVAEDSGAEDLGEEDLGEEDLGEEDSGEEDSGEENLGVLGNHASGNLKGARTPTHACLDDDDRYHFSGNS